MNEVYLKIKGIVKKSDKYLVLKRWVDDRIPDPFVWEFIEGEVQFGEAPDEAALRLISETLGVNGSIQKIVYTWSMMIGDAQCVGIAYVCEVNDEDAQFILSEDFGEWEWIERKDFAYYIENQYVLKDLEGVEL